jgi:hypothetical protein
VTRLRALCLAAAICLTGCTVGQTRVAFGLTVIADAASTQAAVAGGGREASPVLKAAPVPIMLALAAAVAIVAEKQVRDGHEERAKRLYAIASVVHGAAGAWNLYQAASYGVWRAPEARGR